MENNYISEYLGKIHELSKTASPEELLPMIQSLEEIIKKKIEVDKNISDPNRLQDFGTPEPTKEVSSPTNLEPFGTPEGPSNKGLGSM